MLASAHMLSAGKGLSSCQRVFISDSLIVENVLETCSWQQCPYDNIRCFALLALASLRHQHETGCHIKLPCLQQTWVLWTARWHYVLSLQTLPAGQSKKNIVDLSCLVTGEGQALNHAFPAGVSNVSDRIWCLLILQSCTEAKTMHTLFVQCQKETHSILTLRHPRLKDSVNAIFWDSALWNVCLHRLFYNSCLCHQRSLGHDSLQF